VRSVGAIILLFMVEIYYSRLIFFHKFLQITLSERALIHITLGVLDFNYLEFQGATPTPLRIRMQHDSAIQWFTYSGLVWR